MLEDSRKSAASPSGPNPLISRAIDNFVRDYRDGQNRGELRVGDVVIYDARGVLYGPNQDYAAILQSLEKLAKGNRISDGSFIVLAIPEQLPDSVYQLAEQCIYKKLGWRSHLNFT